jgi:hypothetical protein
MMQSWTALAMADLRTDCLRGVLLRVVYEGEEQTELAVVMEVD